MLDIKLLRNELEVVSRNLQQRGFILDKEKFNKLETERKSLQIEVQELQNQKNTLARAIGQAKAQQLQVTTLLQDSENINQNLKVKEDILSAIQQQLDEMLSNIPNMLHKTVPLGKNEHDNVELRRWGTPKVINHPLDHVDLATRQGGMDFVAGAKVSGARFVYLKGRYARLHRALAQFMLDLHTEKHGYQEINAPCLVKANALYGTGQFPKLKDDTFGVAGNDLWLIPTSEVSVTNLVSDTIINEVDLPLQYVCHSPCFRAEAGTYGNDMRGMIRQHQFEKVEMVQITTPEASYDALEAMILHAETVLQSLELPYRVMALCSGDIGFASAKTYDIEVWLPGQNTYREISSCSNTESFQARRMQARLKRSKTKKIEYVHTLNGSGLAVGRTLIAVIENYQDEEGSVHVPTVLQPYMNGLEIIS